MLANDGALTVAARSDPGEEELPWSLLSVVVIRYLLWTEDKAVHAAARQVLLLTCADMATLDRWFDRSLNAATLSDVLDDRAQ